MLETTSKSKKPNKRTDTGKFMTDKLTTYSALASSKSQESLEMQSQDKILWPFLKLETWTTLFKSIKALLFIRRMIMFWMAQTCWLFLNTQDKWSHLSSTINFKCNQIKGSTLNNTKWKRFWKTLSKLIRINRFLNLMKINRTQTFSRKQGILNQI